VDKSGGPHLFLVGRELLPGLSTLQAIYIGRVHTERRVVVRLLQLMHTMIEVSGGSRKGKGKRLTVSLDFLGRKLMMEAVLVNGR
jgi:hypothetical protein